MEWTLEDKDGKEVDFEVEYEIEPGEPMIMNPPDRAHPGSAPYAYITNDSEIEEILGRELTAQETGDIEEALLDRAAERQEDMKSSIGDERYHAAKDEGLI